MRSKDVVVPTVLVALAFVAGAFVDRQFLSPRTKPVTVDNTTQATAQLLPSDAPTQSRTNSQPMGVEPKQERTLLEIRTAFERALKIKDYPKREDELVEIAEKNPEYALEFAGLLPRADDRRGSYQLVFGQWALTDAQAATAKAMKLSDDVLQHGALLAIGDALMADDLDGAFKWVKSLPESPDKESVLKSLGRTWAGTDPQGAVAYVLNLPKGDTRREILVTATVELLTRDPEAGVALYKKLSEEGGQGDAMERIINTVRYRTTEASIQLLESLPDDEGAERLASV